MIVAGVSDPSRPPGDGFGLTTARSALPLPAGRAFA